MFVRTGYGAQSLRRGDILALTFTEENYPMPVSIQDSPARRQKLIDRNIRYYTDVTLRKASNSYLLEGKRGGLESEIITIGYSQPNIPTATTPTYVENDHFNFVDTVTEFMLSVEHTHRQSLATLMLVDCITGGDADFSSLEDSRYLSFWREAK